MSPFDRLGRFVVVRARLVVAAWAVLIALALPLAPQVPGALSAGGFIRDDLESARAKTLLEEELGAPPWRSSSSSRAPTSRPAPRTSSSPPRPPPATSPRPPTSTGSSRTCSSRAQISRDRHTAYDIVFLDLPPDDSPEALPILRERLGTAPGLTVELAGGPAFYGDVQTVSEQDLQRSEVISLPLAALALLLVFGSIVAAGVPLVVGGASVLVALAAIFLVASVTPMSIFVLNLATLLGLGLGVDYSLLMTSRFREELAKRPTDGTPAGDYAAEAEAVRMTVATAGRAVFFSGLTVLLGLLGLVLFEFMILRSVGIAGAVVVGLAVAAALTLLPAILALGGQHLDRFAIRRVRARPPRRRPVGPARAPGHAPADRRPRPDARVPAPPRVAVPARPVQRPRRQHPAAVRPVAGRLRPAARPSSARASSRRSPWPSARPTATPRPRPTSPAASTTRAGSARTRGSTASTASWTSIRA